MFLKLDCSCMYAATCCGHSAALLGTGGKGDERVKGGKFMRGTYEILREAYGSHRGREPWVTCPSLKNPIGGMDVRDFESRASLGGV